MEVIYRVKYARFFMLLWGPISVLLAFGLWNKGGDLLTIETLSSSRIFGNNYVFLIISFIIYLHFLVRITIQVIGSQGLLLHRSGETFYVYNRPKFDVGQISTLSFEKRYFAKFLKVTLNDGSSQQIPLVFSHLESSAFAAGFLPDTK